MKIGVKWPIDSGDLLERLARGERPRSIAKDIGCNEHTIHTRVHRFLAFAGYKTLEQAIADHVAKKIQSAMPLALQMKVDELAKPWKPKR